MSGIYESIIKGLQEAVEDAAGRRKLPRNKIGEAGNTTKSHAGRSGAEQGRLAGKGNVPNG